MTESERLLWVQAKQDYSHALAIATEAWGSVPQVDGTTLQAATATVLIHITKLRQDGTIRSLVRPAAPTAVKREGAPTSQASVAVPACPQCGGDMWDNRGRKKNPKAPDFKCKDKSCVDAKGYNTGCWEKDLKPSPVMAAAMAQQKPPRPFADLPEALEDGEGDDLPF